MSNSKISALTSATTPLAGTETLPIVQSSTTKQVSVANLTAGRAIQFASAIVNGTTQGGTANLFAVKDSSKYQYSSIDTTAQTTGVGGAINLGGNYRAAGDAQAFTRVVAEKVNATDGDYSYNMTFYTTVNNGANFGIKNFTMLSTGDNTFNTGNLVQGTASKGITTGSAINLGLGTNGSTTQANIDTAGNFLVGTTSTPSGALTNGMIGQKGSVWDANHFGGFSSGTAVKVSRTMSIGGMAMVTGYSATGGYNAIVMYQNGVTPTVVSVANTLGSVVTYTVVSSALYITNTGTAGTLFLEANVMTMSY
jgi:hypothetical protein